MIDIRVQVLNIDVWVHGLLIEFGSDFEELQDGIGQFPVAIVLLDDGTFVSRPLNQIRALK